MKCNMRWRTDRLHVAERVGRRRAHAKLRGGGLEWRRRHRKHDSVARLVKEARKGVPPRERAARVSVRGGGGLLGAQVGSGRGQVAGTAVGAPGGAVPGRGGIPGAGSAGERQAADGIPDTGATVARAVWPVISFGEDERHVRAGRLSRGPPFRGVTADRSGKGECVGC